MNSCKCCRWLRRSNWNPLKGMVKTKRVCSANKRDHIENPCNQIRVRVGWSATRRLFRFRSDKQGNARRVTVTVRVRVKIRDALRSRLWLHSQRKTAFASKASGWPQVHFSVSEGGYELSAIEDPYDDDSEEQPAEHCQNTEKKTECSSVGVWMHAKKTLSLSCRADVSHHLRLRGELPHTFIPTAIPELYENQLLPAALIYSWNACVLMQSLKNLLFIRIRPPVSTSTGKWYTQILSSCGGVDGDMEQILIR